MAYASSQPFPAWIVMGLLVTAAAIAVHALALKSRPKSNTVTRRLCWFEWMPYVAFLLSIVVLAGTSFYGVLIDGVMHGWGLLVHLTAAGAFITFLLVVVAIWVPQSQRVSGESTTDPTVDDAAGAPCWWLSSVSFWVLLLAAIATAGPMLVAMLPVLSTSQMLVAIDFHRYAGLCVVIAAAVHGYSLVVRIKGLR